MPTPTQIQEGVKELLNCDVVVRMQSDAMAPTIPLGAILYGKKVEDLKKATQNADDVFIVRLPDQQTTVGRIYADDPKKLTVFYDGREFDDRIEIARDGDVYLVSFIQTQRKLPTKWETEI